MRDVLACDAAGVERTHGQLRAGLADGLGGDDADGGADVDRTARGKVPTVALLAHAMLGMAGHDRADGDFLDARGLHGDKLIDGGDVVVALHDHGAVGALDVLEQAAADEVLVQLALLVVQRVRDSHVGAAINLVHDDVLRDVDQTTGQVTRVGGTQSGVSHTLTSAVRGDEVLQHRQALTEVRLNRNVDGAALGVCHQAAHGGSA